MADVIVFWDDAPASEDLFPMKTKGGRPYRNTLGHYHCGCCPNCRCTPMPLVFVEDLKFPVRVYTNGKIIRMNQGDFDRLYREKSGKLGKSLPNLSEEKPKVSLVSDEMTSEELSRKAKEQKRDEKGQFSKEGNTGQKNSGVSALEDKSSNKVNLEFIKSKEYRNKFDSISDNSELNQAVYDSVIAILSEKNETDFESVHVKDIDGNHIGDNTENSHRLRCSYGKELEERIHELQRENRDFVVIHNHPNNTPPSPKDFYDAFQKGYKFGIIAGHDGSVYKYYPPNHGLSEKEINEITLNVRVLFFCNMSEQDIYNRFYLPNNFMFERLI